MLILVGVTVTVALNGGLFDQARKAAKGMNMAQIQEKAEMVKALLIADLQTNEGVVVVKQEYMNRLQQEFEGSEIKGNKVIVEDGKYGIIVKNGDLDIEITENPNYVDKSELLTLKATPTKITEDGKVYGIEIALDLEANITSEEYVEQETEKAKNISYEEKEQAVLEYLSGDSETQINSFDDYVLYYLNDMDGEITHSTLDADDPDGWFNENNRDDLIMASGWDEELGPFPEEEEDIRSLCYHEIVEDTDLETKWTEKDAIESLYNELFGDSEFNKNYLYYTNFLTLYLTYNNGEEKEILDFDELTDTNSWVVNKNGEYKFVLKNLREEIMASETIWVNNVEENTDVVLTEKELRDTWNTKYNEPSTLTKYKGTDERVVVPKYIGAQKVTKLEDTFRGCTSVKEIIIPNSITSIGESTFYNCKSLTNINIPNSVSLIDNSAFDGVDSVTITFEAGPNSIPDGAPWGATNATIIDMNEQTNTEG